MIENKRRLNSIYDSLAEFENIHLNLSSKVVDCALKLIYQYLKLHQIEFGTLQLNIIELNTERRLNVLEYISKNRLIPIFELTLLLGRFRSNEAINQKVIELHREVGVISKKLELNLVDPTVAWRTKLYELTRQELNELIQANFTNEELMDAEATLTNLKKWKPFRTKEKRCVLIEEQLKLIDRLKLEEKEKIAHAISNQGSSIVELEDKLSVFHQAF